MLDPIQMFLVTAIALVGAGGIIMLINTMSAPRRHSARTLLKEAEDTVAFLFDDTTLVDATPAGRAIFARRDSSKSDWDQFVVIFGPRFLTLRKEVAHLAEDGSRRIEATTQDGSYIDAEFWDGMARLTYFETPQAHMGSDIVAQSALMQEAETLRSIADDSPQLIWKETLTGEIVWANRIYIAQADKLHPATSETGPTWPPASLFPNIDHPHETDRTLVRRIAVQPKDGRDPQWYEVTSVVRGTEVVHFGTDVNEIVRTETMRHNFVQTMGNTFAQLSIGLAIFDKDRRLMIFNPALGDLTGLSVQFLSGRPQLQGFLDGLREMRMLPEPKNYAAWREDMAALELAAKHGTYCENWDIPNGQTFRVTGRPHPDGAIAFLFEDISAEVSLTRRFRAELEVSQAALDSMDEAVAVFSAAGTLTISNAAYTRLWASDAIPSFADTSVVEQSRLWQQMSAPSSLWGQIREFVGGFTDRSPLTEIVALKDGRHLACRIVPMPRGGSLIGFRHDVDVVTDVTSPGTGRTARELLSVAG